MVTRGGPLGVLRGEKGIKNYSESLRRLVATNRGLQISLEARELNITSITVVGKRGWVTWIITRDPWDKSRRVPRSCN